MGTNLLKSARTWLSSQREEHASEAVVYLRDDQEIALQAMITLAEQKAIASFGLLIEFDSVYFVLKFSALENGGLPFIPAEGDRIRHETDGVRRTFRVQAPDGAKQVYQFTDGTGRSFKIHTILVSSEPLE